MISKRLKTEVENFLTRRSQFDDERGKARASLEQIRDAVVGGDGKAIDKLTEVQAKVTALEETIAVLDSRLCEKNDELKRVVAAEAVEAANARILELDSAAEVSASQYESLIIERRRFITDIDLRINVELSGIIGLQNQFFNALDVISPGFLRHNRSPEEDELVEQMMTELKDRGFVGRVLCYANWQNYSVPGVTSFNCYQPPNLDAELETSESDDELANGADDSDQIGDDEDQPPDDEVKDDPTPSSKMSNLHQIKILSRLRAIHPVGCSASEISELFNRKLPATEIRIALESLEQRGFISSREAQTGGRPITTYFAIQNTAEKSLEQNEVLDISAA